MTPPVDLDAFAQLVERFLSAHAEPRRDQEREAPLATARGFQRLLHEAGLAGITWPAEIGGRGLTSSHQRVFDRIAAQYDVPTSVFTLAMHVCGPAVAEFGTAAQRENHVLPILRGDQIWCQLWSEPEAGSDLGAVRTRASRVGTGWRVRGHKIWTSNAHSADYALLLARTDVDAAKHRGLSMFIVPMHAPGVRVEPLVQVTREAEFNEVWLDDVELPGDAILGEPGDGWRILTWAMGRERTSVGVVMRSPMTLNAQQVHRIAEQYGCVDDPDVRRRLVDLKSLEHAAEIMRLRLVQEIEAGTLPAPIGSASKVIEAQLLADAAELAGEIAGYAGVTWSADNPDGSMVADAQLKAPAFAIGGGTTEIQLNALAEQVLRLPREPRPLPESKPNNH